MDDSVLKDMNSNTNSDSETSRKDDIEDVFDQNEDVAFNREFANRQYKAYTSKFYNEGFREALSNLEDKAGEDDSDFYDEKALQIAFDKGYQTAFSISKKLSILISAVKTYSDLKCANLTEDKLKDLKELDSDLTVAQDKLHYLLRQNENKPANEISTTNDNTHMEINPKERTKIIDKQWCHQFKESLDFINLEKRCKAILNVEL